MKIRFRKNLHKYFLNFTTTFLILLLFIFGCESLSFITQPKPLRGEDITVYNLADGQVEFRLKVTGMTSTLWITAELVNNSTSDLGFDPKTLLQFSDPTCLMNHDFESVDTTKIKPQERQVFHFSFQIFAKRKGSPEYERCKDKPQRFTIEGLTLGQEVIKPFSFTLGPE